jgi:hypothetical protein
MINHPGDWQLVDESGREAIYILVPIVRTRTGAMPALVSLPVEIKAG